MALGASATAEATLELEVGIVQRFGDEPTDELAIAPPPGEQLVLSVQQQGQWQTLTSDRLTLEITERPLRVPEVEERLVLSDHATFETAEDSAQRWQALGIEVEITQPGRWQVWAKRDVYKTPMLRRWLLKSLRSQGYTTPSLETAVVTTLPQVEFIVDGIRYLPDRLDISTENERVWVENLEAQTRRLYGGTLRLQPNAYGNYTLVNQVPLETYLRGVVPHEIGPNAPQAAVEAQTIIARTYALRNLRRFAADNYQLCANTHCQVYWGLSGTNARADRAIAATAGQVLTYESELVDALYSSTTGGVTAAFSDIWNGAERPYLKSVLDAPQPIWDLAAYPLSDEYALRRFIDLKQGFNETGTRAFRWRRESSLEQLSEDLKKYLEKTNHPLANFSAILEMEIMARSPSGRILQLDVLTDQGTVELHKTEVRSALGPPRSTLFYLEPLYDPQDQLTGYAFVGGGFGHGVGLSQIGSYNLANLGWTAQQILEFYYPGTEIKSLDESIIFYDGD